MNYLSDYSLWWTIPALIVAGFLSYWYYFKSNQARDWTMKQAQLLALLRGLGLFVLLFLLLGLIWETVAYRKEKPLFITLIDQSQSIHNYKDSSTVDQEINSFRNQLKAEFGNDFELVELAVGSKTVPFENQQQANGKETDLAAGFQLIHNTYFNRNIGGITLISDGNATKGVHPMYEAERLDLVPIFTLGIGDTIAKKDQLIRSVNANEVAFLSNEFPIEATVELVKIPKGPVQVHLLQNGKKIQSKSITCGNSLFDQQTVLFVVKASQKGFQRYTVQVEKRLGEFTTQNNQQTCYVEVLDNKSTIQLLSSAPHPDLAAIRNVLEEDKSTQVHADLVQNFQFPKQRPDLVVWYENGVNANPELFNRLLRDKTPVLLLLSPITAPAVVQSLAIGLKSPKGNQVETVYPSFNTGFSAFGFTADCSNIFNFVPPLETRFGAYQLPANAEVVLNQRIGKITKSDPLFFFATSQQTKIGVLLGEGIWRWKLSEFMRTKQINGFREFIQKTTQYLTVKQSSDPFRITLPKRFLETDDISIKAEFYNAAMELITTPQLSFSYRKSGGESTKTFFSPNANFYQLNLGMLSSGTYQWEALATNNGNKYKKSGTFVVEAVDLESLSTSADFSVLNQLALQSDGQFYPLKKSNELINYLKTRNDIATVQFEDNSYRSLIDLSFVFIVIILIFSTEWFLRRWWGGY
jgi:hypothetical protein